MNLNRKVVLGNLKYIILKEVAEKPDCLYRIIERIRRKYGVYLGVSSVRDNLQRFKKDGLMTSQKEWIDRPRIFYTNTSKGNKVLMELHNEISILVRLEIKTVPAPTSNTHGF